MENEYSMIEADLSQWKNKKISHFLVVCAVIGLLSCIAGIVMFSLNNNGVMLLTFGIFILVLCIIMMAISRNVTSSLKKAMAATQAEIDKIGEIPSFEEYVERKNPELSSLLSKRQ